MLLLDWLLVVMMFPPHVVSRGTIPYPCGHAGKGLKFMVPQSGRSRGIQVVGCVHIDTRELEGPVKKGCRKTG